MRFQASRRNLIAQTAALRGRLSITHNPADRLIQTAKTRQIIPKGIQDFGRMYGRKNNMIRFHIFNFFAE